jgi:glycosidase
MSNFRGAVILACVFMLLGGCRATGSDPAPAPSNSSAGAAAAPAPSWWNGRVFYEVFVRSFADSTTGPLANDGIGDFQGLIEKLDYLNDGNPATTTDLGVTGLWLMPINPSPSYHGYDVTDYYGVNPQYGTRADFERFLAECHKRGIRVIMDLVLNHSSSEHPDFKRALAGDPKYRNWYIFVDPDKVPQTLGPWNQIVWQRSGEQRFFGIFWSGMPDLNYRNPEVTAEAYRIADFWLNEMHVDGFRLDAVRHLIEDGDVMSDTPETVAWLQGFEQHLRANPRHPVTIGEVWTNTEIVSDYVQKGALDLAFEFDLAGAMLDAADSGTKDKLAYTLANVGTSYPPNQFATFLTNHDQDRVANVLRRDPAKMRLAAALLLTGPGVPFLYYGEEIGQIGAKPDELIRNPMPWSSAINGGFTGAAKPWERLQKGFETRNVAAESADPESLLSFYRRLIRLRQSEPALATGDLRVLETGRNDVIAWQRGAGGRTLTVVANLGDEDVQGLKLAGVDGVLDDVLGGGAVNAGSGMALAPRSVRVLAPARIAGQR